MPVFDFSLLLHGQYHDMLVAGLLLSLQLLAAAFVIALPLGTVVALLRLSPVPILRAIAPGRALGMVHIDAHCDTGDDYLGSRFHHGAPFRRAVEEGLLDPRRVIQIGIRGSLNSADMWQFSHDTGMRVVPIE